MRPPEKQALEDFRDMKISLEELRPLVGSRMSFEFQPRGFARRSIEMHVAVAKSGVSVSAAHLQGAFSAWKQGQVSRSELADWAAMLLMNDDYEFVPQEEEIVADWLNQVALDEAIPEVIKA